MCRVIKNKTVLFFIIISFIQIVSIAQTNGPNAPEAASFEPVDATDMVNLSTGDLTYVLPLLNVPSPEGGYPIALAYHAGIAMDQESSWVGLGWNLNPGAINRSVNGYPDEYNSALLTEYFYDAGGQDEIYSLSIGYSAGVSVGVGLSWGSNRSLGGSVSIGYGIDLGTASIGGSVSIGTDGASIGLGATFGNGLTLGASASSNGTFGGSIGFDNNGAGFSVGATNTGSYSVGISGNSSNNNLMSLDINFSSSGVGISGNVRNRNKAGNTVGGAGVGLSVSFNNAVNMGDYTVNSSGWGIPLVVPTPIGIFSLSFGKQKIRYYLGKKESNYIDGPLYFYDGVTGQVKWEVRCQGYDYYDEAESCGYFTTTDYNEAEIWANQQEGDSNVPDCQCEIRQIEKYEAFMDMYEVPIDNYTIGENTNVTINNLAFPSYDKYNVQAQGLSGSISSRLFDNGALFGLSQRQSKNDADETYKLKYSLNSSTSIPSEARFTQKPFFYMDNEISSYTGFADVSEANYNNTNQSNIIDYYNGGVEPTHKPRRTTSNYIEYFTNEEIVDNYSLVKSKGFLMPIADGDSFDRTIKPKNGIGGFKITSADGKTYHYSLPVYNHEIITRTSGAIKDENGNPRPEWDSYFEKRQLQAYATHWLITAVTGPDYIDKNDDGIANDGDYGYWVNFSYGKWSDAWAWKSPYRKDYILSNEDAGVKTWVRGRKELFYLNSIKTRTHTAYFIKSPSGSGLGWSYKSVNHISGYDQNSSAYIERFKIPHHFALKLDRIILLKNSDANGVSTINSLDADSETVLIKYNQSKKPEELARYNSYKNVITARDIPVEVLNKSLKMIDLSVNIPLFDNEGKNNGAKNTLKSVIFKGKGGVQSLPPYKFGYYDNPIAFNVNDKDQWGYHKNDNKYWSLKQITTPQGGKIVVDYESHQSMSPINHEFVFSNYTQGIYKSTVPTYNSITDVSNKKIEITSGTPLSLDVGDQVRVRYNSIYPPLNGQGVLGKYYGMGTITNDLGNSKYEVTFNDDMVLWYGGTATNIPLIETYFNNPDPVLRSYYEKFYRSTEVRFDTDGKVIKGGGVRVSKISVVEGVNSFNTEYEYGENGDGIGYVSYLPYSQELEKEVPYSAELPAPKVMYEYVTTKSSEANGTVHGKMQYKFNIIKDKDNNQVKFGNFYEIAKDFDSGDINNSVANKSVNIAKFTVKDNLASVGQLLEVKTFNEEDQLLNITLNEYYDLNETPNSLGITQEAYQTYKEIDFTNNNIQDRWIINSSKRVKYPSILKKTTSITGGYKNESTFSKFNSTSGQSDEIITVDSQNRTFKTEYTPAYTIPEYSTNLNGFGMGSKVNNITNKNMLTQKAMTKTYIDLEGSWKEINVGITTWNNEWTYPNNDFSSETPTQNQGIEKIWRKHKNYLWDGDINIDGTYQSFIGSDDNFDWSLSADQINHRWSATSTITKYNHFSSPLEINDLNGNTVISKMCNNDTKVLFTANSKYYESFYTGAEYYHYSTSTLDNQVLGHENLRTTEKFHTGKYSLKITPNDNTFGATLKGDPSGDQNYHRAGKYKMSVWVHKDNYLNAKFKQGYNGALQDFNGEIAFAGDWVQLNHYFERTSSQTYESSIFMVASANGTIYVDDFRLHPLTTSMTSYVYDDQENLHYILGSNNLGTRFIYDESGRLYKTFVEVIDDIENNIVGGYKLTTKNYYNYKY